MSDTGHGCTFCEIDDYCLICGSADNWGNSKYAVLLKIDKDGYIVRARWKGGVSMLSLSTIFPLLSLLIMLTIKIIIS